MMYVPRLHSPLVKDTARDRALHDKDDTISIHVKIRRKIESQFKISHLNSWRAREGIIDKFDDKTRIKDAVYEGTPEHTSTQRLVSSDEDIIT